MHSTNPFLNHRRPDEARGELGYGGFNHAKGMIVLDTVHSKAPRTHRELDVLDACSSIRVRLLQPGQRGLHKRHPRRHWRPGSTRAADPRWPFLGNSALALQPGGKPARIAQLVGDRLLLEALCVLCKKGGSLIRSNVVGGSFWPVCS